MNFNLPEIELCSDDTDTTIMRELTTLAGCHERSLIANYLDTNCDDWIVPPIDGDCYTQVDAILIKHRGKWKPIGRKHRVALYEILHFRS